MNHTECDLTIAIFNTSNDKINKLDVLRPFERRIIERSEVLGCAIILEDYITDKGKPLMFTYEKSQCLGEIEIGVVRVFGANSSWKIDDFRTPRTETDGGGGIFNTSH